VQESSIVGGEVWTGSVATFWFIRDPYRRSWHSGGRRSRH